MTKRQCSLPKKLTALLIKEKVSTAAMSNDFVKVACPMKLWEMSKQRDIRSKESYNDLAFNKMAQ